MRRFAVFIASTVSLGALFIVVINDNQAQRMFADEVAVRRHNLSHLVPPKNPEGFSARSGQNVVMLNTHELDPATRGPGILQRELTRQAFLLAGRDVLGLATRDKSLREA